MAGAENSAAALQHLLDEFNLYDYYVDVVSAFEWLFTQSKELPKAVRHFERFPRIALEGTVLTPDFTVVFTDGTGLVVEIARIAQPDASVDSLCTQIGKYAQSKALPIDTAGTLVEVTDLDVLLLVPNDVGLPAVQRVIKDRFADRAHPYSPPKPPAIAQFSRSAEREPFKYTFAHIPDPANGELPVVFDPPTLGFLLSQTLNITADKFKHIKAARKFMNDPINPLYLAVHLWTATWPTEFGGSLEDIDVEPNKVAETLRKQFDKCRSRDVKAALGLLARAGLAVDNRDGTWTVFRGTLRMRGERDVHRIIAAKAARKAAPVVKPRSERQARPAHSEQASLF